MRWLVQCFIWADLLESLDLTTVALEYLGIPQKEMVKVEGDRIVHLISQIMIGKGGRTLKVLYRNIY